MLFVRRQRTKPIRLEVSLPFVRMPSGDPGYSRKFAPCASVGKTAGERPFKHLIAGYQGVIVSESSVKNSNKGIFILLPVLNEKQNIAELLDRIETAMAGVAHTVCV